MGQRGSDGESKRNEKKTGAAERWRVKERRVVRRVKVSGIEKRRGEVRSVVRLERI